MRRGIYEIVHMSYLKNFTRSLIEEGNEYWRSHEEWELIFGSGTVPHISGRPRSEQREVGLMHKGRGVSKPTSVLPVERRGVWIGLEGTEPRKRGRRGTERKRNLFGKDFGSRFSERDTG